MQFYFLSPDSCFSVEQFLNMLILDLKLRINYIDPNNPKQGHKLRNTYITQFQPQRNVFLQTLFGT